MNKETDKLEDKDIVSQKEIEKLANINKAWHKFWHSLKTFGIKLVASEGMDAVYKLVGAFKLILDAARYVIELTNKFQGLKMVLMAIGVALAAYFAPISAAVAGIIFLLSKIQEFREGKEGLLKSVSEGKMGLAPSEEQKKGSSVGNFFSNIGGLITGQKSLFGGAQAAVPPGLDAAAAATAKPGAQVNQTNTFNVSGSVDKKTGNELQKHISNTARQIGAQAEGR